MYKFASFLDKPTTIKGKRLLQASCNSIEVQLTRQLDLQHQRLMHFSGHSSRGAQQISNAAKITETRRLTKYMIWCFSDRCFLKLKQIASKKNARCIQNCRTSHPSTAETYDMKEEIELHKKKKKLFCSDEELLRKLHICTKSESWKEIRFVLMQPSANKQEKRKLPDVKIQSFQKYKMEADASTNLTFH